MVVELTYVTMHTHVREFLGVKRGNVRTWENGNQTQMEWEWNGSHFAGRISHAHTHTHTHAETCSHTHGREMMGHARKVKINSLHHTHTHTYTHETLAHNLKVKP